MKIENLLKLIVYNLMPKRIFRNQVQKKMIMITKKIKVKMMMKEFILEFKRKFLKFCF